jgi:hypothetical protein
MTNIKQIPQDLTPLERARLKLISHIAIIAVFNGLLAALSYLGSLASGAPVNWGIFSTVIIAQMILAILDASKKYVTAKGDVPLSALLDMARQEVAAKTPQIAYNVQEKAVQSAISSLYDSIITSPSSTLSTPNNGTVAPQAQQTAVVQHTNIQDTPIFSTLPEITAVKPQ